MALAYLVTQVHRGTVVPERPVIPVNQVGPVGPAIVVSAATQALPAGPVIVVTQVLPVTLAKAV